MYLHNERGAKSICDRLYSCRRQYSSVDLFAMLNTGKKLVKYLGGFSELKYEGRTESHEQLFYLHANWEQQTKESAVVDGTSCCVILESLMTSIACIT